MIDVGAMAQLDRTIGNDTHLGRWLARELHDSAVQELTLMLVDLEGFKRREAQHTGLTREVDRIQDGMRSVLFSLRQLLFRLRDQPVVEADFARSVGTLVEEFEDRTGIETRVHISPGWPSEIPSATSAHLYRIVQEALANVRKHSCATTVEVAMRARMDEVVVEIHDDGAGHEGLAEGALDGMGLKGMRERASILGGTLCIDSSPSRGTTVTLTVPGRQAC